MEGNEKGTKTGNNWKVGDKGERAVMMAQVTDKARNEMDERDCARK